MPHSRIVPAFVGVALVHVALIAAFIMPHDAPAPRQLQPQAIVARLLSTQPEAVHVSTGPATPSRMHAPQPQPTPPSARAVAHRFASEQPIAATRTRPAAAASHLASAAQVPSPPDQTAQTAAQRIASSSNAAPQPNSSTARSTSAAASIPRDTSALAPKPVDRADCRIAKPTYPELSKRRGEAGTAMVRFVIDATGAVSSIALIKSSGFARLDDAAVQALRESVCRPYVENGSAIRVSLMQAFTFGLDDD